MLYSFGTHFCSQTGILQVSNQRLREEGSLPRHIRSVWSFYKLSRVCQPASPESLCLYEKPMEVGNCLPLGCQVERMAGVHVAAMTGRKESILVPWFNGSI